MNIRRLQSNVYYYSLLDLKLSESQTIVYLLRTQDLYIPTVPLFKSFNILVSTLMLVQSFMEPINFIKKTFSCRDMGKDNYGSPKCPYS